MSLVSVLIPVYNVEKYIEEAVNSILNQSYKNIELIIVDDFSNDSTFEILKVLKEKDNRIKLFRNSENMKIVKTLNFAFMQSKGEYICRMDGDDISQFQRIEKKVQFLKENSDISLVGCSVESIDEHGKLLSKKRMPSDQEVIARTLKYANPVFHIWLARREVYDKLGGYREISYVEDYDFLLRMVTLKLKFTNLSDYYGYSIRFRSGNTISQVGIVQRKAHRYCYELYEQRRKNNKDEFSIETYNTFVKCSSYEQKFFEISNNFLRKALIIKKRFSVRKYLYLIFSYFASSEQRKYINGKLMVFFYIFVPKFRK